MPLFSVIIPLYNKENDIEATLNSVFEQSFNDYEIIVVDDGSSDNSLEVASKIKDQRLKIFSIPNSGAAKARNYAVNMSSGTYIAFLDADDYWYPNHLQNFKNLIDKFPQGKWFTTAYEIMHNNILILPMDAPPMKNKPGWMGKIDNFFKNSMGSCMAWTSAVCMRKDFFEDIGGFNITYQTGQDVDLWIRAALKANLFFSTIISARYNLLGSNRLTHVPTNKKKHMDLEPFREYEENDKHLKKYLDLIRYSYVIKFKLSNNKDVYKKYLKEIDLNNLTVKQKLLIRQNPIFLRLLETIKEKLEVIGVRTRSYKK